MSNTNSEIILFRASKELKAALNKIVKDKGFPTKKADVMRDALEDYLGARGYLPSKQRHSEPTNFNEATSKTVIGLLEAALQYAKQTAASNTEQTPKANKKRKASN